MNYLLGTDEAGYGPNLGPLTVCGTLWRSPSQNVDLYELLSEVVSNGRDSNKLPIADSKAVYSAAGSIRSLETAVLAALYSFSDSIPTRAADLPILLSNPAVQPNDPFGLIGSELKLPLAADVDEIKQWGKALRNVCHRTECHLERVECQIVMPRQFNAGVQQWGNKAELLSAKTLTTVKNLLSGITRNATIVCDKHGGRKKYLALLHQHVTSEFVSIVEESANCSRYAWKEHEKQFEIRFQVRGESFLPTALASMIAKYVREVAMVIWNRFWALKIPGIRPTKGYPVDAKRFKREIETVQLALGIDDESIWRHR